MDTKDQLLFVVNNGAVADSKDGLAWRRWPITIPGSPDPLWGVPCNRTPGIDCEYGGEWYRKFEGNVYKFVGRATVIPGSGRFDPPSITVYPLKANGDVAPLRVIQGDKTGLSNPTGVFVDGVNNELLVANWGNHTITVYPRGAGGNLKPLRVISPTKSRVSAGIGNPGAIYVDPERDEIGVIN